MRLIEQVWFHRHPAKWWLVPLLLPLSALFWLLSSLRRILFKVDLISSIKLDKPIVVVGNIGIGGNGKTPVVLYLVEELKARGIKVGVLSRGYGGKAPYYPYQLDENSSAEQAGDEPVLIYQRTKVPVVVGPDRVAAATKLIEVGCQLIISDDGLQHYRLQRDVELLVVDGKRLFGNGLLLPAGPLRETTKRLNSVDALIINGESELLSSSVAQYKMSLQATQLVQLTSGNKVSLTEFLANNPRVDAIAGIGDPQRFFHYLAELGFSLDNKQGFVDHQVYNTQMVDAASSGDKPLLMTEKDAVKCVGFAKDNWWYLPVDASFSSESEQALMKKILSLVETP